MFKTLYAKKAKQVNKKTDTVLCIRKSGQTKSKFAGNIQLLQFFKQLQKSFRKSYL